jgi:hypothetical protein
MQTLHEAKQDVINRWGPIDPESEVIIHQGGSGGHELGNDNCWCKPIIMTGKQFMETEFIY